MTKHPTFYLKLSVALLFVAAIFGYSLFQARHLIAGPIISISSPHNGAAVSDPLLTIRGRAQNISYISLNDRQIFTDERGFFSETLLLPYGYTIMTVKADDKFGREAQKTLELIYK